MSIALEVKVKELASEIERLKVMLSTLYPRLDRLEAENPVRTPPGKPVPPDKRTVAYKEWKKQNSSPA